MSRSIILMMMVLLLNRTAGYFNYSVDCEDECINESLPCTIVMINFHDFPCNCISSNDLCKSLATDFRACLMEDGSVSGGSKIWEAYNKWAHPNSTTTTTGIPPTTSTAKPTPHPQPTPSGEVNYYKLYAFGVTMSILSTAAYFGISTACQRARSWYYRPMPEEHGESSDEEVEPPPRISVVSGQRSPESPYAATTEDR